MRYNICLAGTILIPVLFFCFLIFKVIGIEKTLVKQTGVIHGFKKTSGGARSDRSDSFKLEDSPAIFSRQYSGLSRVVVPNRSRDIYELPPVNAIEDIYYLHPVLKDETQRRVNFYVPAADVAGIGKREAIVPYIYLKFDTEQTSTAGYYLDICWYMYKTYSGGFYTITSLFLIVFCAMGAAGTYQYNKLFIGYLVFIVCVHIIIFIF